MCSRLGRARGAARAAPLRRDREWGSQAKGFFFPCGFLFSLNMLSYVLCTGDTIRKHQFRWTLHCWGPL